MAFNQRGDFNTPRSLTQVHIVVDNSNLFISAQLGQGRNGEQDLSIRINVAKLVERIEKEKRLGDIKTRIVGGSKPPRNAKVWTEWEKCNYICLLGDRSFRNKEEFLDDMLHSQIQKLILKNLKNGKQHLILITGDGNSNNNRTSFPEIVTIALDNKWIVHIWAWKASCSQKFFELQKKYPEKLRIDFLDQFRSEITFKQKRKEEKNEKNSKTIFYCILPIFLIVIIYLVFF